MFSISSVSVKNPNSSGWILENISGFFSQHRISVIGANGSGKSSFLRLINGLLLPDEGEVTVLGKNPKTNGGKVRREVGFIFADPAAQAILATPLADVELSLKRRIKNKDERKETAQKILAQLGLLPQAEQSIYTLSSGERQLVALAALIAIDPKIVVADEPTTLLDLKNRNRIIAKLFELPAQLVYATHDLDFAQMAEYTLLFSAGKIIAEGTPKEVVSHYLYSCV